MYQFPRFARDDNTVSTTIGFHQISRLARNSSSAGWNVEQRDTSEVRFKHQVVVIPSAARELCFLQIRRTLPGTFGLTFIFDAFDLGGVDKATGKSQNVKGCCK